MHSYRLVKADDGEGEIGRQEKRISLKQIVVPVIAAVEDGDRLRDVEVKKSQRGEGPLVVIHAVDQSRQDEDEGTRTGRSAYVGSPQNRDL